MSENELERLYLAELQGYLRLGGPGPQKQVDALLKKNPALATVPLKDGLTPMDHALAAGNGWLVRKLALAAQIKADATLEAPFEQALTKATQGITEESAYAAARAAVEETFLTSLDRRKQTLTPEVMAYRNDRTLGQWAQEKDEKTLGHASLLHRAAQEDRADIIELLVERKKQLLKAKAGQSSGTLQAYLNTDIGENKITAPILAAKHGATQALLALHAHGADMLRPSLHGGGAPHVAAAHNHVDALESLRKKGVDLDQIDWHDSRAFDVAVQAGHKETAKYFIDYYKERLSAFPVALQQRLDQALGHARTPAMADMLMQEGANPNGVFDGQKNTPLHKLGAYRSVMSAYGITQPGKDMLGVLQAMMDNKANPKNKGNLSLINERGGMPLYYAIDDHMDKDAVLYMIEKTNDISAQPEMARAYTMYAAIRRKDMDIVRSLLEKDSTIASAQAYDGENAMHAAVTQNQLAMVRLLKPYVKRDVANWNGHTALCKALDNVACPLVGTEPQVMADSLAILKELITPDNRHAKILWGSHKLTPVEALQDRLKVVDNKVEELKKKNAAGALCEEEKKELLHFSMVRSNILEARKMLGIQTDGIAQTPAAGENILKQALASVEHGGTVRLASAHEPSAPLPQEIKWKTNLGV